MNKPTIYLAGCTDLVKYRKKVIKKYSDDFDLIDPIERSRHLFDDAGVSLEGAIASRFSVPRELHAPIVEEDKLYLNMSNAVVVYIEKPTFGTSMEIMYCYEKNIPVFIITKNEKFLNDVWLTYHASKMFTSIKECFKHLKNEITIPNFKVVKTHTKLDIGLGK